MTQEGFFLAIEALGIRRRATRLPAEAGTYFFDPDCGIVFTDVLDDVLSDRPASVALLEEDFGLASQDAARVCKLMVVHLRGR